MKKLTKTEILNLKKDETVTLICGDEKITMKVFEDVKIYPKQPVWWDKSKNTIEEKVVYLNGENDVGTEIEEHLISEDGTIESMIEKGSFFHLER